VVFEEYDLPGLTTIDGIAAIAGHYPSKGTGERAAWFRDSEGNLLGIGQPIGQAAEAEHERLAVLIGKWKTEGRTREMPDAPAATIDAVDTYEWLPGGFGLLHVVDATVGETRDATPKAEGKRGR
jgi:hypothetical protein